MGPYEDFDISALLEQPEYKNYGGGAVTSSANTTVPSMPAGPTSGLLSLGLGIKQLYDANNVKLVDTVPNQWRTNLGEQTLRANSAQLPNFNQVMGQINRSATNATNQISSGATSSDQIIQGAGNVQSRTNAAVQDLAGKGAMFQQGNIDRKQNIADKIGERMRQDRIDKATREAMLTEAGWRNLGNFAAATDANSEKIAKLFL